ncbi:MAG: cobalt transporter CbiM [Verrucomicrobiota bacterium]
MHIPDGYLSPSTCAVLYAGAAPFWAVSLKRTRTLLHARMVPLISLVSAFSFVIMMFNIPLPGGTTGHAVGMAVSAILLGPWASILAISVALLIQAVFFGDGGITSFGANSFNMAIVGSLVAYAVYRLISGRAPIQSPRRVIAAALAGYAAINASALCAAIEFGIQPGLFHDASGAPLYAPYPLGIAIPAMMIGHLSLAGIAELVISGGLISWLQHANPALLKMTASGAKDSEALPEPFGWAALRPLWIGLAAMMIATPLGLLAAGTAWGEWGPEDFKKPEARQEITAASHNLAPPKNPPAGLERLGSIWSAPIPDYAPAFLKNQNLGYVLSAMFGTGLIIFVSLIVNWLSQLGTSRSVRKSD